MGMVLQLTQYALQRIVGHHNVRRFVILIMTNDWLIHPLIQGLRHNQGTIIGGAFFQTKALIVITDDDFV
jgi:hypothetical protein